MVRKMGEEYYTITRTCKDDMIEAMPDLTHKIMKFDEDTMKGIAQELCDDYINQLYWESLEIIVREVIEGRER